MRIIYPMLMLILASSVCAQNAESEIRKQITSFSEFMMANDRAGVVGCYVEDAKIMPSNTGILEGEELEEYWNPKKPGKWVTTYHKINPVEIKIWGDEAYDYGYYEGSSTNGEEVSNWKGKYVIIWRKENDIWKIYLDIWNPIKD